MLQTNQHPTQTDVTVVIPAAGSGERLGLGPKARLSLAGEPLIGWVTRKALRVSNDVVVAVPPGEAPAYQALCPQCRCIEGGATRQTSVARLVQAAEREFVLLNDLARPFASVELHLSVLAAARRTGIAGAFLVPDVPVARLVDGRLIDAFARTEVALFQAPQAYARATLVRLLDEAEAQGWQTQSTLELAVRAGREIAVVPGEKTNLKLTTIEDWHLAQHLTKWLR